MYCAIILNKENKVKKPWFVILTRFLSAPLYHAEPVLLVLTSVLFLVLKLCCHFQPRLTEPLLTLKYHTTVTLVTNLLEPLLE
ncbi:hypothetical protein GDO78_021766 [Eleutherodactylus coqui]|uniref:Uncharacterized protein n=1 Tax=Eleutherodactylus coqui TaxID=57060 RepID=A0A8J6E798_ELECQ|nr:hypothetical protein GDO78_021766 [Eleutherodactylus coqui]